MTTLSECMAHCFDAHSFVEFYAASMRSAMFTGFLTLSGFLFSVNTFIVVNMKKELYEKALYLDRVADQQKENPRITVYGSLRKLSREMLWAVVAALVASSCQFTIGLVPAWPAVAVCLLAAVVAFILLARVLHHIRQNLTALFEFLDLEAVEALKKRGADKAKLPQ